MGDSSATKRIVIIGTGHAATVLGRLFVGRGHAVVQVYGRHRNDAETLALELGAEAAWEPVQIRKDADLCIVALADAALPGIERWMPRMDALVAHTAGSVPMEVLQPVSEHFGVFYPLQSLRSNQERIPEIPFLVQGSDRETEHQLRVFARSLGSEVHHAGEIERRKLHLSAVFTSNFTNHLYTMAHRYCVHEGIEFRMLLPLLEETVLRLETEIPENLQTGPALRGDEHTIQAHLDMLEQYPDMRQLYEVLTNSIRTKHNT